MPQELPIRIILVHPPKDVIFCVQRGKAEFLPPAQIGDETITFELTVRVGKPQNNGAPNLLGPYTHGTVADRFVYVNSGTLAGHSASGWTRRAKVKLAGITHAMIETALNTPGAVIEARINGKAKDGGPPAASVPLLGDGWQIVQLEN
jgi:Family of unknown function (DUF5990)